MNLIALNQLLARVVPASSEGADLLLDLRQLLIESGHPGRCVRCFFGLLNDLREPGSLQPLRHWLEQHLEVEVSADGRRIDRLPVRFDRADDLDSYCRQAIDTVRQDRSFDSSRIDLRFRFKDDQAVLTS